MSYAASFLSCELFLNNRSLGRVGGYFFAIASRYPVATTNKTIASTSVILTHPLSGERYRRGITPAQGRFICIIHCGTKKHKRIFYTKAVSIREAAFARTSPSILHIASAMRPVCLLVRTKKSTPICRSILSAIPIHCNV